MVNCTLSYVFVRARKEIHVEKLTNWRNSLNWKSGVSTEVFSTSTDWGLEKQNDLNKKWNKFSVRESKSSTTQKTDFVPSHISQINKDV